MYHSMTDVYQAYADLFGSDHPVWSQYILQQWIQGDPSYDGYESITDDILQNAYDTSIEEAPDVPN